LLLLALPILAGKNIWFFILPALNLAICWKLSIIFLYLWQSAENLKHLDASRIFRDYTPISIFYENYTPISIFYENIIAQAGSGLFIFLLKGSGSSSVWSQWVLERNLNYNYLLFKGWWVAGPFKKWSSLKGSENKIIEYRIEQKEKQSLGTERIFKYNLNRLRKQPILINNRYFHGAEQQEINKRFINLNPSFCSYLAGLIEGDGTIIVPKIERSKKGKLNYPSIEIAFDLRDFPLAMEIQKKLGCGSICRIKGVNSYRLTVNNNEGVLLLVNILNGYMRTPKIEMLYLLIKFLNNKDPNLNLIPLGKDLSNIDSNDWLAGFIDADGHFSVSINEKRNAPFRKPSCRFEIVQSSVNHLGLCKKDVMLEMSKFINTNLGTNTRKKRPNYLEYRIRSTKLENNLIIISYLNKFKLFSSKYLNYLDWVIVINIIKEKKHKTIEGIDQIRRIKDGMNNKRTIFIWDHLQNFHNLYR